MSGRANVPGVRVVVDGKDITPMLESRTATGKRRRLVSLAITEKRGDEADQLDIVIDDTDGQVALPRAGARIEVAIGWLHGIGVEVGLVDKGSFVVEDVEHAGPPDLITIRARAADFTSEIRTRREHSWHDTTLGAVVDDLAKRNALEPRCAPALASIAIAALAQSRESDIAFLRRLGKAYDALASVKDRKLILSPVGALTTTTGRTMPGATIRRRDGDRHVFKLAKPEEAQTVEATWHDRASAKRQVETHGSGGKTRRLSRVYPNQAAAKKAAEAEQGRAKRSLLSLNLELSLGRAALYPNQRVSTEGFKANINTCLWIIHEVTHSFNEQGFRTGLTLQYAE